MENKIPTAEELINFTTSFDSPDSEGLPYRDIKNLMIEFAKLHCEAQTEAILKITHKNGIPRIVDNKESIIDAYPLTNIK